MWINHVPENLKILGCQALSAFQAQAIRKFQHEQKLTILLGDLAVTGLLKVFPALVHNVIHRYCGLILSTDMA
jgi:hypothetical protein